jgi:hypothetical protein
MLVGGLLLSGCSQRILGIWEVENFEVISSSSESVKATQIGTISFEKDGSGHKSLSFSILGLNQVDKADFSWSLNDRLLTISGDSSAFVKTWIVMEDKRNYQKFKSTDGAQQVQVMELRRQKK